MREILDHAYRLLARREYAVEELRRKLVAKWHDQSAIDSALGQLVDDGSLSDRRFARSFVRSRVAKYQGPRKIRANLKQRGVPEQEIESALESVERGWTQLAADWLGRQAAEYDDYDTRAKFYRRLCNRGFTHAQAMTALDLSRSSSGSGFDSQAGV